MIANIANNLGVSVNTVRRLSVIEHIKWMRLLLMKYDSFKLLTIYYLMYWIISCHVSEEWAVPANDGCRIIISSHTFVFAAVFRNHMEGQFLCSAFI